MDQPKQKAKAETEDKIQQQLDLSPVRVHPHPPCPQALTQDKDGIAYRELINKLEKPLGSRYIRQCSQAHKVEFTRLLKGGMNIKQAKEAHSDYSDWAFGELIRAFLEMED
jgi:hypothetical protein